MSHSMLEGRLLHEPKKHHWIIAAEITTATTETADGSLQFSTTKMNGVIVTDNDYLTALDLGKGNQLLQQMFMKKFKPDPAKTEIVDIFTISVSHIGFMKNTTFQNLPIPEKEAEEEETPAVEE